MTSVRNIIAAPLIVAALSACQTASGYGGGNDSNTGEAGPGGDYRLVSELVDLPEFIPGMGKLYVEPDTLPAGPFVAYDRDGEHVSTIYMIPLDEMNEQSKWTGLDARGREVERVGVTYNPGHPGVDEPHYHITLWHVPKQQADLES